MRLSIASLLLLCIAMLALNFRNIDRTLPYPQHVDEPAVATAAARMLTGNTLHPSTFNYPSLPKYIAAGGLALGFLSELTSVDQIGNVGFPYYTAHRPMLFARMIYAAIAALTLVLTGWAAWLMTRSAVAIALAPLALAVSPLFAYHSWAYLNVDIVATFFVTATIVALLLGTERPSVSQLGIVPGLLTGLAIGSKYTHAVTLVPVLLTIAFYAPAGMRLRATLGAIGAMAAAFLVVMPYSILDITGFLTGLAYEAHHYASGHPGYEGHPGWPQLQFYLAHFTSEFGVGGIILALVGVGVLGITQTRRVLVLLSLPAAALAMLVVQRVHFTRNVLALHPLIAIFIVSGLLAMQGWVLRWIGSRTWSRAWLVPAAQLALIVVLVAIVVPPTHLRELFRDRIDSRNVVEAWLAERISHNWTIVIPTQLSFDDRRLIAQGHTIETRDFMLGRTDADADALLADIGPPSIILIPDWGIDPLVPGEKRATDLRKVSRRWQPFKRFGTEPVVLNHENNVPVGNPAINVAPLHLPAEWLEYVKSADRGGTKRGAHD